MNSMLLKEYVRSVLLENAEYSPEFVKAINEYVRDSWSVSFASRKIISNFVEKCTLRPGLQLERISEKLPGDVGSVISYSPGSFSKKSLSSGEKAGHIAWKYSDVCMLRIENPTRGWEVDYDIITTMFPAFEEAEVLVAGNYKIVEKVMITEPGTYEAYGYKVPLFILEEA